MIWNIMQLEERSKFRSEVDNSRKYLWRNNGFRLLGGQPYQVFQQFVTNMTISVTFRVACQKDICVAMLWRQLILQ